MICDQPAAGINTFPATKIIGYFGRLDGRNMVVVRQNTFGHDEIAKLLAELREDDSANCTQGFTLG